MTTAAMEKQIKAQFWQMFKEFGQVDEFTVQQLVESSHSIATARALISEVAVELSTEQGMSDFELVEGQYSVPSRDRINTAAPVADTDQVYTVGAFKRMCISGEIVDFSGYFVPAANGIKDEDGFLPPSAYLCTPDWATHVVWYPNNEKTSILEKVRQTSPSELFDQRVKALPELEKKAGVQYTFWLEANKALEKCYGVSIDVDWRQVQYRTAELSIHDHGQQPEIVKEALSTISPICVSSQECNSMIVWVEHVERMQVARARRVKSESNDPLLDT